MDSQVQQAAEPSTDSTQPMAGNEVQRSDSSPRSRWYYALGVTSLAVLLVGAAFVGGRLLSQRRSSSGMQVVDLGDGRVMMTIHADDIQWPDELPKESPTAHGFVTDVGGKTITIGQPKDEGGVVIIRSEDGESREREYENLQEVVVTQETLIYRNKPVEIDPGQETSELPPMEVEEVGLADVGKGDFIAVWGEKHGDRIVAEVIHAPAPRVVTSDH
ncbi:MAG: hypothetical protein SVX38_15650 [Chloroflexota bacterium]|nr:hypothetical protein [Chloroflexota bacterium]